MLRGRVLSTSLVTLVGLLALPAAGAGAARGEPSGRWWRPVPGPVVARFGYARGTPFAAGQRRVVDLAAAPGDLVAAPCAGRVSYAGRVPGGGTGVSIRCGALTATLLGLATPAIRRGAYVGPGQVVGRAGAAGRVRLGARVTADRFGYRDPLALLGPPPPAPGPLVPGRRGTEPRAPSLGPAPVAVPALAPRRVPLPGVAARRVGAPWHPLRAPVAPRMPLAAWLGVALLALAVPAGGVLRARGRRSRARSAAGQAASARAR